MKRGSLRKTSEEKRGNPKKYKGAKQKRPLTKKEATPQNEKGLIKKISEGKSGTCKAQKSPTNIHVYRSQPC
jgi:hypothetical protein